MSEPDFALKCSEAHSPNGVRRRVNVAVFAPAPPFFRARGNFFVIVNPFCCCMTYALPLTRLPCLLLLRDLLSKGLWDLVPCRICGRSSLLLE